MTGRFLATLGVLITLAMSAHSQDAPEFEFRFEFEVEVALAKEGAVTKKSLLFDKYANAVEKLQSDFQKNGDLANAVKTREEARKAREQRILGSEAIPNIDKLRKIMVLELDKVQLSEIVAISAARKTYIGSLMAKATALTKEGKLDEALAMTAKADAEKARFSAEQENIKKLSGEEKPVAGPTTARKENPAPLVKVKSPLDDDEAITGPLALAPGLHRLRKRAVIGIRGDNKETKEFEDIKGEVTSGKGTVISGGGIYLHNGTFKAEWTKFEKVRVSEELQGRWYFTSCLLDDCEFEKDGGWWASPYSARWDFENCVIKGNFFNKWDQTGLKVINCTFQDVKFHRFDYKKNASEEATSNGRRLINCLFENCTVPASFALATKDCIFRNCKFTGDMGDDLKVESEIETTLYFDDNQEPKPLKLPEKIQLIFKPAQEAPKKNVGSSIRFVNASGKLEFE